MATNKEVGATPNLDPTEKAQFVAAIGAQTAFAIGTGVRYIRINDDESITQLTALQLRNAVSEVEPYTMTPLTNTGNIGADYANGSFQKIAVSGSGKTFTIIPPVFTGGTLTDGLRREIEYEIRNTGTGCDLALNVAQCTDAPMGFPYPIQTGYYYVVKLKHDGVRWVLRSFLGGYANT